MKILVAEDDPVSRKVLVAHLEKWGYEVTQTNSGDDAWRAFEEGDFSMAILDWMMPGMDGIERRGWISLRVSHEQGQVVIRVQDNGHGIAAAHLPHIFEPFYALRLPADRRMGLGLAISDAVIREHGGTLHVQSVVNRGTTFTVRLPSLPPEAGDPVTAPASHSNELNAVAGA
jgi:phosphoglycerate-specific signal transduction histidine kinase